MWRRWLIPLALLAQACGGDDTTPGKPDGEAADAPSPEASLPDVTKEATAVQESGSADTSSPETGTPKDSGPDGDAGGCPSSWLMAPVVDPAIAVPSDGGSVLLHVSASGTQNYLCALAPDGGYAWSFVGPAAQLFDCNSTLIGHHFASDGGPTAPEWQTTDGTYVVGNKLASFTPDAGPPAVPWLLLGASDHGGAGTLSRATYIQRVLTQGGLGPITTCDQDLADSGQSSSKAPYSADYYFFGQ